MAKLTPYNGGWNRRTATHLLWRAQSGASALEIEQSVKDGLGKTVERLLQPGEETEEFKQTEGILRKSATRSGDIGKLKAWWLYRMLRSQSPLTEKMTLLWHNHFATSNAKVDSVDYMLAQNELMRRESLGNFRQLLGDMARDTAMLIWLDGNANRKRQPNENFAREVMELFSLGEGNYSEKDIQEAARAFTGWHLRGEKFWFNKLQHDTGQKSVLGTTGNLDGTDIIEICLQQEACPKFIAFKLLKKFVTDKPTDEYIAALGSRISEHDYEMAPVLRELFSSEMFYAQENRHSSIKGPVELVIGAFRALGGSPNWGSVVRFTAELGQNLFEPPTVKGWEGGRLWINSTTLLQRRNFAAALTSSQRFGVIDDPAANVPRDAESAARHFVDLLLSRELPAQHLDRLTAYLDQSTGNRSTQLRGLIQLILSTPEFQLV